MRKYLYCIIPCRDERTFDAPSIGTGNDTVHTVCHEGLAMVVSDSAVAKYETTRQNMLAHEMVLEKVMREFTLLPVRFGTVTESDSDSDTGDIRKLLHGRFQEFSEMLEDMKDKAELGLKAFWRDEKAIYAEIMAENPDLRKLRNSLSRKPPEAVHFDAITLGRMVKESLERKKDLESTRILVPLRRLAERVRENDRLLDRIILNAAFLVRNSRGPEFDQVVRELDAQYSQRVLFKYVGPVPPYNFVDIVVNWQALK